MTAQEILEGITRHRANSLDSSLSQDLTRKIDEIEWALQAIAEWMVVVEPKQIGPHGFLSDQVGKDDV